MNETLKRIGFELRRRYQYMLSRPMNWRMIDAFVRLEEVEEKQPNAEDRSANASAAVQRANVVDLPARNGDAQRPRDDG